MRASLIEKGIAQPVLKFAHADLSGNEIPPPPPPPPLPPPRNSSIKENIYTNVAGHLQNRTVDCQTTPSLQRPIKEHSKANLREHKIREEEITVCYKQPPFIENFRIYQGYQPKDRNIFPVTYEPTALCIHDNDSKTYETITPGTNSPSSTEELFYSQKLTCKDIKKHCCYYIFCCGLCCD